MTNEHNLIKSDFYFELPTELIAQSPIEPRDASRLLVHAGGRTEHRRFFELVDLLQVGDLLVVNNTRVIYARLFGRDNKGRQYEVLLLKRLALTTWEALLKPAKKLKLGDRLTINSDLNMIVLSVGDDGVRTVEFEFKGVFEHILASVGNVPLPPYITAELADKERYQTVYGKHDGSSAAPTAGLHFTSELIAKLKEKGVQFAEVLLHVGLGTFRPVKCENIASHAMHSEHFEISEEAAAAVNRAIEEGRRIIAVGTTSVRTLESAALNGRVEAGSGDTSIFIYPPYDFKITKGIITNFHLPESTLIMLVSAFVGREKTLELYDLAVKEGYRFFSFGDAMLLL